MCDAVVGRIVAWLALVGEGRTVVLLVLRRRRAVGMDIHDCWCRRLRAQSSMNELVGV
jgi:hypothetical protein